ncbi:hypothetical protein [Dysgonomonas macrotermitis]|uniref:Uncharacterized protein n=1 Tax=Dysgonomonas macrotermitis TaxID=1346286 RepID=A0A1M5D9S0_9BACT|nr:hypothetical protein [Dysgonomonas macrotermitis]SHF63590.1 hypothetical protein SAMN05444362_108117 [Dysgonomonas macrotermitis]
MKLFLRKVLLFMIFPVIAFVLLLAGYVIYDPFMVVKSYSDYSHSFQVNRGHVSTEVFLRNYQKEKYNSFIFGSSRVFGYHASSWEKHLGKDAKVYSFDAYGEKISGMYHKLRMLDEKGVDIKNVLLCFDTDYTYRHFDNEPYFLYIEDYRSSDITWIEFHRVHFEAYFSPSFLYSLYANKWFGVENEYVRSHYFKPGGVVFDTITNQPSRPDLDKRIQDEPDYYETTPFYTVVDSLKMPPYGLIDDNYKKYLEGIKEIFEKHHTNYKVVLNPLYSQAIFFSTDMKTMQGILGADHIYDFTGHNWITVDKHNYYEESHFRPFIGDSIMTLIYNN